MLALRPNCECCDRDLPPDSRGRDDLHLRMHLLRGLRRGCLRRHLPQLHRRTGAPADPSGIDGSSKYPPSTERVLRQGDCLGRRAA